MIWRPKKRAYLDIAAGVSGNPSSPHAEGRHARDVLEAARTRIARLTETKADDVIFTSGATEANALAILGAVRAAKPERGGAHLLYLPSAHASLVENALALENEGVEVEPLPVRDWRVDADALAQAIRPETVLVTMDAVCGETGNVWNTREVRAALDAARGEGEPRILLHTDASQAPYTQNLTRAHFGADLVTLDASKVSSVRGAGCLIAHRTIALAPLYRGGGQERGLRPGSEFPHGAHAFAAGLARAAEGREAFAMRAGSDRAALLGRLRRIEGLAVNEGRAQSPHILNLSFIGRDTDYLAALLDASGFAVSTRSACETDSIEGSRAVMALTRDVSRAKATLRISWGPETSERDLARFSAALIDAVAFVDSSATL